MILIDLNVLLYAVNRSAAEYSAASSWMEGTLAEGRDTIGLAWAVIFGFLRLSTSSRLFQAPLTVEAATQFLNTLLDYPAVRRVQPGQRHWPLLRHMITLSGTGGTSLRTLTWRPWLLRMMPQ